MTRLNLLIIDTNQLDRVHLATFLANLGHASKILIDIDKALDVIAEEKPQLVFVNEELSTSNAQDFIIKASQRKVFTHTAFLFMSDHNINEATKVKYMSLGYSYFVLNCMDKENLESIQFCLNEEISLINLLKAA